MKYLGRIFLIAFMGIFIISGLSFVGTFVYAALFKPSTVQPIGWWAMLITAYTIFLCYKIITRMKKNSETKKQKLKQKQGDKDKNEDEYIESEADSNKFDERLGNIFGYFLVCLGIIAINMVIFTMLSFSISSIYTRLAGDRCEATVVDIDCKTCTSEDSDGDNHSYLCYSAIIEFQTKDGETLTKNTNVYHSSKPQLNEKMTIYYSPENDDIFIHSAKYYLILAVLFFFCFILLIIGIRMLEYALYGKLKHKFFVVLCKTMAKLILAPILIGCSVGLWYIVFSHNQLEKYADLGIGLIILIGVFAFILTAVALGYLKYLWKSFVNIQYPIEKEPKDNYNRSER